jgi:multidrug efflux pump
VQAAINAAQTYLPPDLPAPPIYSKSNPADAPVMTLAVTSKTLPLARVEDLADTRLAQKISQLFGVGLVSISGGHKPAVRVQANPTALSSYRINLDDLRTTLQQATINQARGSFDGPQQAYQINANDQLLTSNDYSLLVVAYNNGAPVVLSDVARVVDDVENSKLAAWMNKTPAVILKIQRQPGANAIQVVDRIKQLLPQLTANLPAGIDVSILTDRTTTIRASVQDVQFSLMLTVALVVMAIFLFLRNLPATAIPSAVVPLSLVGTFGVMYLLGFSLNNLTLMALTISTGFVVDDAIVMIENVFRYLEQGETSLNAALKGARQIGFTIISLTVSLIAVLIPLLFMGDIVGRLFREFAITLGVTILLSALISLTLTPMMCSRLLKQKAEQKPGRFYKASERFFNRVTEFYGRTLGWVLKRQKATLLLAAATLVLTVFLCLIVPKGLFPVQDTGIIQGISEASQNISFTAMAEKQQALADVVLKDPAVESLSSFIGIDGTNTTLNSGRMLINLKPLDQRMISASDVIHRLQLELDKVDGITLYMQPVQDLTVEDRVSRTQFQYTLEDASAGELNTWTNKLVQKLQTLPELRDLATDQQTLGSQAKLVIDRVTASRLGITPQAIDNVLYDAFGQRQITTLFTQLNQYHLILEALPEFQKHPAKLNNIYLKSNSGGAVPLSAFTHFESGTAPLAINRQGQFPSVTISFNLAPGVALGQAVIAIQKAQKELGMPLSVQASFQGTAAAFQASLKNEPWLILAAIVAVYIVLGVLYESYIHPITILSTLPSAGVGALLALLVCRSELGVVALIGIILLIGIVKKNAIMIIDFALDAQRNEHKEPADAIYQACLLRFRPIMMTTFAALFGALPLALGNGVGAELRQPLGITIVGGLLISQVLTLYTTPVIYLFFDRLAAKFSRSRVAEENASSVAAPEAT